MARKRSRGRKSSRLSMMFWMILTGISGGGVGGYLNPNWPIIGPFIKSFQSSDGVASSGEGSGSLLDTLKGLQGGASPTGNAPAPGAVIPSRLASTQRPTDKILIASFNIQVFGESKLAKPEVVEVLVQVIRQFDIVAIQEVRAQSDDILPRFLAAINSDGSRYNFIIGPRLGRSNSKEQYAFIFNTDRIEHDPSSVGTVGDPKDLLHREPFVARFRPRTSAPEQAFSFWMVDIHTDPDEVKQEVAALADVFQVMQTAVPDEDDVILLGDLNASETQLGPLGQLPGISWVVSGGALTNTRQTKAYDNVIFNGQATSEYTGRWGIVDLEKTFGLTRDQALAVSDHFPVWAEFSIWEAPKNPGVAGRLQSYRR